MLDVGQIIGNYRVVKLLGQGGMGAVYEAMHQQIGRRAAIKVLHPHISQDAAFALRFINEARAVNIVDHPGLVQVFEFGTLPDRSAFIVMEFLNGESLGQRLERLGGHLPLPDVLRLGEQIASALGAAHQKKIVHRDLKPDNVIIVPDPVAPAGERTKLLDFGIAKLATEYGERAKTETGALMGTPQYMSPEQCEGVPGIGDRADVYAFGVMIYEMLAGRLPIESETRGGYLIRHMTRPPTPLVESVPGVPKDLAALVHAMLEKAPQDRPSMKEVEARLQLLQGRPSGPLPVLPAAPASRPAAARSAVVSERYSTLGAAMGQTNVPPPRVRKAIAVGTLLLAAGAAVTLALSLRGPGQVRPAAAPRPAAAAHDRSPVVEAPAAPKAAAAAPAAPVRPPPQEEPPRVHGKKNRRGNFLDRLAEKADRLSSRVSGGGKNRDRPGKAQEPGAGKVNTNEDVDVFK